MLQFTEVQESLRDLTENARWLRDNQSAMQGTIEWSGGGTWRFPLRFFVPGPMESLLASGRPGAARHNSSRPTRFRTSAILALAIGLTRSAPSRITSRTTSEGNSFIRAWMADAVSHTASETAPLRST